MTDSRSPSTAVIALVVIAAVAALAGGLVGGSEEIQQTETHDFVAEDHPAGEAVVVTKRQIGGFSALGLTFSQPQHYVRVTFTLPASCDVGDAEQWPIANPRCTGPEGLSGSIAGGGQSWQGEPIVAVDVLVDSACYGAIELGMIWSPAPTACEVPGS